MDTDFIASDRMAPPPHVIGSNMSQGQVYRPTTVQHRSRDRKLPSFQTTLGTCLGGTAFFTMTVLMFLNLLTDIWVLAVFGLNERIVLMGISVIWLAITSFCLAVAYAVMTREKQIGKDSDGGSTAICFCSNMLCQLGILGHRFYHFAKKAEMCQPNTDVTDWSNQYKQEMAQKDWVFVRLFLAHGILQSGPMVVLNLLAMLINGDIFTIQYVSAVVSFAAMIFSATIHEKARKERLRKSSVGPVQTICIWLYYGLIIIARVVVIGTFGFFYRKWLTAVLVPHFILVAFFFLFVYRNVWKVRYYKILIHSFYCIFAYFPVHNEYRPEGEIMIFYAIFLIENVLMVALPYAVGPTYLVHKDYAPGSSFYRSITVMVLVGSAVGLVIIGVYYFFLHRSRDDIQKSHFSCFGGFCDFAQKPAPPPRVPVDQTLGISKIYLTENVNNENQTRQADFGEKFYISDMDETDPPPAYRSHNRLYKKRGESTSTDLNYKPSSSDTSDMKTPLATSDLDTSGLPSVLDGDDEYDSDAKPPRQALIK